MPQISLRFAGNEVAPQTTRCKELAAVISAAEDLLLALMGEDAEDQSPIPLCLVSIETQSLGLKFAVHMAMGLVLWQDMAAIINSGRFERMAPKVRQAFGEIVSFVKRKGCTAYLGDSEHGTIATFDFNISIPAESKFRCASSIIGEVVRVGGSDPKVRVKLPSGRVLSCDTTEAVARQIGHMLYEPVTCNGRATWDYETGELLGFKIEKVRAFQKVRASDAFGCLANAMPSVIARLSQRGIEYAS